MTARAAIFTWQRMAGVVALTAAFASVWTARPHAAATITIFNNDSAGEGFNDPTPAAPVGGNAGTTLGQQRLIAFQHAANIWGATLSSAVTIVVSARFDPLTCTATGAVLGSAGPTTVHANFTNAPVTGTWYHQSLANRNAGFDLSVANPDIAATFNSNLGQAGCLTGTFFYLGLDGIVPAGQVDLAVVLLHEFGHGLGFSTVTNGSSGAFLGPPAFPSAYDRFLFDKVSGLTWDAMTNAQRAASAISVDKLVWIGANVTAAVPSVLTGTPELTASTPSSVAGTYLVGAPTFGPGLTAAGVSGEVMPVSNPAAGAACNPLMGVDGVAVNNKVALIDRGTCGFTVKVKNAQNAGARAVIMVNNAPGSPPPGMAGTDPTITIPSLMITQADGAIFKDALRYRSRTSSGVFVTMRSGAVLQGADAAGHVLLFAPNPFQSGSSVSHWDTTAFRNLLMEPFINAGLTHSVLPPFDLTFALLRDIGW